MSTNIRVKGPYALPKDLEEALRAALPAALAELTGEAKGAPVRLVDDAARKPDRADG